MDAKYVSWLQLNACNVERNMVWLAAKIKRITRNSDKYGYNVVGAAGHIIKASIFYEKRMDSHNNQKRPFWKHEHNFLQNIEFSWASKSTFHNTKKIIR